MALSFTLMKNWAVAELGLLVRAMAMVPRSLVRPVVSKAMGVRVDFSFMSGPKPPPWIMKPSITRWNTVPSYWLSFTYCRKLATVFGALRAFSSMTMSPWLVLSLTLGDGALAPGACAMALPVAIRAPTRKAQVRRESRFVFSMFVRLRFA